MRKKSLPIEEVTIHKLVHGGQGMGLLADGRKCFAWGALPGEKVLVQLTKRKKDWAEGYVTEVLTASRDRIKPIEPEIYMATSPWQILEYSAEADTKQAILAETFEREGIANVQWEPLYQQKEAFGYRNKMEYNFWYDTDTNQVSLALHRRGSHQKVSVQGSALASDAINNTGRIFIDYINKNGIEARPLKSVIIRSSADGTVGLSLFVNEKAIAKKFKEFEPENVIFEILYSDPKSPASILTEVIVSTEQQLSDRLRGKEFCYTSRSFFQVNVPTYEKVVSIIAQTVSTSTQKNIIDMYSGVGSIGLTVIDDKHQMTLVEVDLESVKLARQNSASRKNANVVLATAESALEYITGNELVILDPPRAGLHKNVTERLVETKPQTIIYLSCNPSTQARDIKALLAAGYKITYAQGYNFFPRTPHIESLCILQIG